MDSFHKIPKAVSDISDLSNGTFKEILEDAQVADPSAWKSVNRVLLCSGKIYYDLLEEREKRNLKSVALIRIEQLFPWPEEALAKELSKYSNAKEIFYVQEEPRNMGAWMYLNGMWSGALANFGTRFPKLKLSYIGREACASPAVGSKKLHDKEQQEIIAKSFQD